MGTIRVVDRQHLRARGPSEEWRADQWLNGAIGLAQCAELTWQLRGEAEARQVDGARVALQHNLGLGGAAVVTLYRKDVQP